MLPRKNELPDRTYEAKKIIRSMSLDYEKILAYPNDCILYRKKYEYLEKCSVYGKSWYKANDKSSTKVLWYFSIILRFKRMFKNAEYAKNLTWHSDGRIIDSMLWHPADFLQWNMINGKFSEFESDARNHLWLGLSISEMNPHGNMSSTHSTWLFVSTIYNLPLWLCMKHKFLMISLLISDPRQPENYIDVYLALTIEYLKII